MSYTKANYENIRLAEIRDSLLTHLMSSRTVLNGGVNNV